MKVFIPARTQYTGMSKSRQGCSLRTSSVNIMIQETHIETLNALLPLTPQTSYPYPPVPSSPILDSSFQTSKRTHAFRWSCESQTVLSTVPRRMWVDLRELVRQRRGSRKILAQAYWTDCWRWSWTLQHCNFERYWIWRRKSSQPRTYSRFRNGSDGNDD